MADFIALKGCRFGETVYKAGENIPEAAVNPKRVRQLTALGIICAVVAVQQEPPQTPKKEPPKEPPQEPEQGTTTAEGTAQEPPVSPQEPEQEAKTTKGKEDPAKGKKTTQKAG